MMQDWFIDAKFGIFIHWGIYSTGRTSESWEFFSGNISHEDYMAQAKEFTASQYDPNAWAKLFADAGAKYAVLTTKHHDGFALWDTKLSKLNSVEGAPAGRDLIGPYCDSLRRHGLKVGLYFSHLDWTHPDYATVLPKGAQPHDHSKMHSNPFAYPQNGEHPERWEKFLQFHRGQLKELCEKYKPDLLWFDGDWERDKSQWRFEELREQLHAWCPNVILNSRMGGHGDFGTIAGLPHGHFYGASTMSKDRRTIYLFNFDRPIDSVAVKGIRNNIKRAGIVGGAELKQRKIGGAPWAKLPGILWIDVPEAAVDPLATVIEVELEGELDLYTGSGDAVTFNH